MNISIKRAQPEEAGAGANKAAVKK